MTSIEKFTKRASTKYLQEPLMKALIGLNTKLCKKYNDTLNCSSLIYHENGMLKSRYCWNRWCRICNRIRTGQLINDYSPALDAMRDKYLVTLTIPNVPGEKLRDAIRRMNANIRQIQENRRQRDKRLGINAIRKLECTYNASENTYHPHFHFIVDGLQDSQYLRYKWLELNPNANPDAQDIRECYSEKELFKYFTKLTSSELVSVTANGKVKVKNEHHYPEAIDTIFQAIERIRIIQPMGNVRIVKDREKEGPELIAEEADETITQNEEENKFYMWNGSNWYSPYTGEMLTNFVPCKKLTIFRGKMRYLNKEVA